MKTIHTQFLFLTVSLLFISCSSDNEILDSETVNPNSQEKNLPVKPLPDTGALELQGLTKGIKKYQNGNLQYWAEYYYKPDGNLYKVNYGYAGSEISDVFTNTYHYNTEGKLIKLDGHDVYNYHWDKDRIVEVDRYNAMWSGRSRISYTYNSEGQIIQRIENNLDFFDREKTIYSYFEDGNIKTIEEYGDYNDSGEWILYFLTKFDGYIEEKNLFLELEIIPGQNAQHRFPTSMSFKHLTAPDYDLYETYQYKYDGEGRVVEKIYNNNKVIYEYY